MFLRFSLAVKNTVSNVADSCFMKSFRFFMNLKNVSMGLE